LKSIALPPVVRLSGYGNCSTRVLKAGKIRPEKFGKCTKASLKMMAAHFQKLIAQKIEGFENKK
jgi:hypothetical protein